MSDSGTNNADGFQGHGYSNDSNEYLPVSEFFLGTLLSNLLRWLQLFTFLSPPHLTHKIKEEKPF